MPKESGIVVFALSDTSRTRPDINAGDPRQIYQALDAQTLRDWALSPKSFFRFVERLLCLSFVDIVSATPSDFSVVRNVTSERLELWNFARTNFESEAKGQPSARMRRMLRWGWRDSIEASIRGMVMPGDRETLGTWQHSLGGARPCLRVHQTFNSNQKLSLPSTTD